MSAATELRRSAEERLQVKAAKLHPPRTREETQRLVHERPLRLLLIEDSEDDALLLVLELRQGGFDLDFARVDAPQALEATLDGNTWDAVIADYNMPAFSGLDALRIIQAKGLDLPFILVSGVVGEAMAVEAMKAGAHDFIMKGNFSRLAPALERELQEAEVRQERRQAVGELHRSHEGLELGIRQRTAELARTNEVLRAEISEHKRTENELRASEEKFATMFRAVPIAMALATSSDGALYDVNPAWLDLAGFARKEEVIGKTSLELGLIGDAAQRECILNEFRQNGFARNVELTFSTRKGIQRTVLVNLDSVEIGGSAFILSTMEEITERKRAEDALRESMSREQERAAELATLLDTVPTPVFVAHDIECLHITGNRAADELLYIPRGAEASLSAPVEVRPCHFRALKDGRELRLDELPAQRSARGAHVEDFEFSIAFDDGTIRHVLGYGTPLRNEDGLPRGAVHVLVDITERKRAEEELLKANSNLELRVKERTEDLEATLDKLTREVAERKLIEEELQQALEAAETANSTMRRLMRTVAHEFRTPLGLLTGSVDILDRYWDRLTQEKRIEQNEHIRNAASQMSNLVNSVIAFNLSGADKRGRPPQLYDIGELCRSIAAEAEKVWCAGHEFIVSIDAACGSALIDDVLFRRILQNLLSNSCKFTESHETVSLLVRRSDDMLLLEITDTGIGIPEEDQESIFDAFYRSRNVEGRRGLGLGLSIVREALLQMGGTIKVTSRIGKGTTMRVEIPLPDP